MVDKKITALNELTIIAPADLFAVVDADAGETKKITHDNFIAASSTEGDTLFRNATQWIRLAKGAANLKMFMNAGATAPEWANGFKYGATSIDTATATGTQAITGVGFKPSTLIFLANVSGTPQASIGFDDGTNAGCITNYHAGSADTWDRSISRSIILTQGAGNIYDGVISALGADGFTISWTKTGAKTGTANIFYIAIR